MAGVTERLEDSLVRRCVAGERVAWRALHRRYYPIAIGFLRRLGVGSHDLEDACQEVFVRCFRGLPSFRGEAELKTWLYRLCLTEATRVRRRQRIAHSLRQLLLLRPSAAAATELEMSQDCARRQVELALNQMSKGDRAVFVMYELEGLAGKQIAEVLRCPESTVWRRLHYARRTFRKALGVDGATGDDS